MKEGALVPFTSSFPSAHFVQQSNHRTCLQTRFNFPVVLQHTCMTYKDDLIMPFRLSNCCPQHSHPGYHSPAHEAKRSITTISQEEPKEDRTIACIWLELDTNSSLRGRSLYPDLRHARSHQS